MTAREKFAAQIRSTVAAGAKVHVMKHTAVGPTLGRLEIITNGPAMLPPIDGDWRDSILLLKGYARRPGSPANISPPKTP